MSTQNRSRAVPAVRGLAPEPTLSTRSRRTRQAPASAEVPTDRPAEPEAATQRASIRRGSAVTHVYEMLRAQILSLQLAPGEDIDDAVLVERLGLSRTPIREALARLAGDGLVVQSPNRGVQVAPVNLMDLPRFAEALSLLQRAVMRAAAQRRTAKDLARIQAAYEAFGDASLDRDPLDLTLLNRAFHVAIAEASHNRYLCDFYAKLLDAGARMLSVPFGFDRDPSDSARAHTAKVEEEHREILEAIRRGDADRAEALGAAHAELFRSRFVAYFEQNALGGMTIEAPVRSGAR